MFLFPFVDVSFLCRYTVNLVVFFVDKKLTGEKESPPVLEWSFPMWFHISPTLEFHPVELPDRSVGSTSVLPVSAKDKDTKLKEENTRLLNGNSMDSADRVWNYHDKMAIILLKYLAYYLNCNIVMLRCRDHEHKWMESKFRMKATLIVKLWKHDKLWWRGFCHLKDVPDD